MYPIPAVINSSTTSTTTITIVINTGHNTKIILLLTYLFLISAEYPQRFPVGDIIVRLNELTAILYTHLLYPQHYIQ